MALRWLSALAIATVTVLGTVSIRRSLHHRGMPHVVEDIGRLQTRGASAFFKTTGVTDGGLQQRIEIRDLQSTNPDLFNLYLLGLAKFQQMPQEDRLSYYQIAGIHGLPWTSWDGLPAAVGGEHGYCPHISNIFPTWHRPYLALFEQLLYANIVDVVNEFPYGPDHDKYSSIASTFRLPYWDWARAPPDGENLVPDIVTVEQVQVTSANGTYLIDNPLFQYKFNPTLPNDFLNLAPWAHWNVTIRWPDTTDPSARPQIDKLISNFQSPQWLEVCGQTIYNLFAFQDDFNIFSSNAWKTGNPDAVWDNIESIHDNVHGSAGGDNGDLTIFDLSAFDPIFWLHHANVDRLIAMWQVYHPHSYVVPMASTSPVWWAGTGFVMDANTDLQPFRSDDYGNYWTSETARSTEAFGYTYPETSNQTIGGLVTAVNKLYMPHIYQAAVQAGSREQAERSSGTSEGQRVWQYSANFRVQRLSMNTTFTIYLFLGHPAPTLENWISDPSLVGFQKIFAGVPERNQGSAAHTASSIPLTSRLARDLGVEKLQRMNQTAVIDYLQESLHWKILAMNGTEIQPQRLPELQVSVASSEMRMTTDMEEFPQAIGRSTVHIRVTDGKPAGYSFGNTIR